MEYPNSQDLFSDEHPGPKRKCLDVLAPIPSQLDQNDLYYSMKTTDRGLAIIFSHEVFEEINGITPEPRDGTSKDVERLWDTFSDLGFKISLQKDKTCDEIMEYVSKVSKMDGLKNYDCLVVCVLTHGDEFEVIFAKDTMYHLKGLVEPFTGRNCIQLANKPKLFFVQACKGKKSQSGILLKTMIDSAVISAASKTCVMYSIPEKSDVLVAYATIEGYSAMRDPTTGSPYIKCLCEELNSRGSTEDLLTILIRVHHRISTTMYNLDSNKVVHVQPSFLCFLNRLVRFDAPSFRPQTQ